MTLIYKNKGGLFNRLEKAEEVVKKITYKKVLHVLLFVNVLLLWYLFSIIIVVKIALRIF